MLKSFFNPAEVGFFFSNIFLFCREDPGFRIRLFPRGDLILLEVIECNNILLLFFLKKKKKQLRVSCRGFDRRESERNKG